MPALDRLTLQCLDAANDLQIRGVGRSVLLLLCLHADRGGACTLTVRRLHTLAGSSERYARECLHHLEAVGLLRVDRRPGRTSSYQLTPGRAASRALALPPLPPGGDQDPWPG